MVMAGYILFLPIISAWSQQSPAAEEILQTVRQMNAWIQDVAFDWEVRGRQLQNGDYLALRSGSFRYRPSDGGMWIEFYEYQADGPQYKYNLSYLGGVKRKLSEDLRSGSKQAETERLPKRYRFEEGDLPWQIINLPFFTDLSARETAVELLGWEKQGGHRCAHLAVYEVGVREAGRHLWVDLSRDGHPLRVELRVIPDVPRAVVKDIVLEEVPGPERTKTWFPVKGTTETISEGRPVYRSELSITKETIRFNQGLTDREFHLALPTEVAVTDLNRTTTVPAGSAELVSSPGQVPTVVADTIRRAEQQKSKIEARSRARVTISWVTVVSWALGGIALVLLATILYLRRARS